MRKLIVLAIAAMALALTPFALADATQSVYNGSGTKTQQDIQKAAPAKTASSAPSTQTTATPASGALPFTGMDLGLVVLAGIGLAVMGYSLRRLARDTDR